MKLILKTVKQEFFELETPDSDLTIYELKQLIEIVFGFDSLKLKLVYKGVIFKDQKNLSEYKIEEGRPIVMSNVRIKDEKEINSNRDIDITTKNENNLIENYPEILNEYKEDNNNVNTNNLINLEDFDLNNQINEEKIYEADIKAENAIKYVASIMKVLTMKSPEKGKEFFKNLEEDNPQIAYLIKKSEAEFKTYLYSTITKEDEEIYNKFFKGGLKDDVNNQEQKIDLDLENINKLVELGFKFEDAKQAYYACDKKFESALTLLLEGNK